MSEDKKLNEVIRVKKRPSSFVMIDKGFLENSELSWKAKGMLAYLLSKPDNWKVITKDLVNHATDGKAAVYSGLNELKEHGYYEKKPVRDESGKRISHWEGTVYECSSESLENTPSSLLTDFQDIDNQDIENQDIENRVRNNNDFSNNDFNDNYGSVGKNPPAPTNIYGEFQRVCMAAEQYDALITAYGRDKTADYINRLDRHIASTGKRYADHYATIKKWVGDDDRKQQPAGQPVKKGKFNNFEGRKNDYSELDRLEQQHITDMLGRS